VRTSPPVVRGCTLAPPRLTAPPPSRGGGGSRAVLQPGRSTTPPPERFSSPPCTPPPLLGLTAAVQARCRSPPPAPPPPPQQGSQAGRAGWLGSNYLVTALSPTLDPHGPVLSEMARAPTTSQPSPGKTFSRYTSAVSIPACVHASFFVTRMAVMRF
jgi:hypothetical protein